MPHFARAAEIEPSYVFAYVHMGIYQHQQGDFQGALQQYQKVISLTQNDISSLCRDPARNLRQHGLGLCRPGRFRASARVLWSRQSA